MNDYIIKTHFFHYAVFDLKGQIGPFMFIYLVQIIIA